MFKRILIANRGEIALRIIRACKEMGIKTVAVYSEADRDALYLRYADDAICIGPAHPTKSYLDISRIISAAEITDVEAIHPGYGFLSENSHFAEVCRSCMIDFIGPTPQAMTLVGDKARAREVAHQMKVSIVPGSVGIVSDEKEALEVAHKIGFPVMIKASLGGGGRGMRKAHNDVSLVNSFLAARNEAEASFKNTDIYIEKCIDNARHVEVQIIADNYGNIVHLGERDCSVQRRHQKLVEETPSPVVDNKLRQRLGEAARKIAKASGYTNVGTVEFLVDSNKNFFFMEMNSRLQVEHPVTEMVTGRDIVADQIRIAAGEKLGYKQDDITINGVAIECRINAEDPEDNFKPCPGKITQFIPAGGPGVRVDTHVYQGYTMPPYYDSLLAKLIVHRPTRSRAITTMKRALNEFVIEGVKSTIPICSEIFGHSRFVRGEIDTNFLESNLSNFVL